MSMTAEKTSPRPRLFKPWGILAGLLVGLTLLSVLGRNSGNARWHDQFTRYFPSIAPDSLYQPTVGEMSGIVRKSCSPERVLVIVGGNSILYGVGQPQQVMWTRHLQTLLGAEYQVINFAFRGSSPTDGGAVIAEALRHEYPKIIYIANIAPLQPLSPLGIDTYRFLILDAYYKGKLLPWAPRDEAVKIFPDTNFKPDAIREMKLAARADSWLYFRDFWTRISFRHVSFLPWASDSRILSPFQPRKYWSDLEPNFDDIPREHRFSPATVAADSYISELWTAPFYTATADGGWEPTAPAHDMFRNRLNDAFPEALRARTLIVVGRNSPFYTQKLSPQIVARDDLAVRATVDELEKAGYAGLAFGKDYAEGDFGDRTHLSVSGGRKLANDVAPKVKEMAEKLGYVSRR